MAAFERTPTPPVTPGSLSISMDQPIGGEPPVCHAGEQGTQPQPLNNTVTGGDQSGCPADMNGNLQALIPGREEHSVSDGYAGTEDHDPERTCTRPETRDSQSEMREMSTPNDADSNHDGSCSTGDQSPGVPGEAGDPEPCNGTVQDPETASKLEEEVQSISGGEVNQDIAQKSDQVVSDVQSVMEQRDSGLDFREVSCMASHVVVVVSHYSHVVIDSDVYVIYYN